MRSWRPPVQVRLHFRCGCCVDEAAGGQHELDHRVGAFLGLEVGEAERARAAHLTRIALHHAEIRADQRR